MIEIEFSYSFSSLYTLKFYNQGGKYLILFNNVLSKFIWLAVMVLEVVMS